ncbi:MAG: transposase [Desulfobacteraceae bacterium]|nr:transposase [Desulfobacteraceae bacterium]
MKHKSKGKLRKSFNNKLQRWSYPKVMTKAEGMCEEGGVRLIRINPAYTSQTCHMCGVRDRSARNGEIFMCKNPACYNFQKKIDADWNAAVNILTKRLAVLGMHRGHKTGTVLVMRNK